MPRPKRVVDMSSISDTGSAEIRKGLSEAGVGLSQRPGVGQRQGRQGGQALVVASVPKAEYDAVQPLLAALGRSAMYVGEGEARAGVEDRPQHHVRGDHPVAL